MSLPDLQILVWDFYKDVYGVRPRHLTEAEWDSREYLLELYEQMCAQCD